jgi:ABC-type multidrug transport system ATPase subunit
LRPVPWELSGGWKQRLALAACVLHKPRLLLLDEPTAGVDARARRTFWDLIADMAAGGMTALVSTHYMDEAERCHRVVYLSGGRLIVEGSAEDVVNGAKLVAYEATGKGIAGLVSRARALPGVENSTVTGTALRLVGTDRAALEHAVGTLEAADVTWQEVAPRLDDVFIHLLSQEGNRK